MHLIQQYYEKKRSTWVIKNVLNLSLSNTEKKLLWNMWQPPKNITKGQLAKCAVKPQLALSKQQTDTAEEKFALEPCSVKADVCSQ